MNRERIRELVKEKLAAIAPDADVETLSGSADFRDELDLDSMDFLKLVTGVHEDLGVDIPEVDYGRLSSLDEFAAYVEAKQGNRPSP